MSSNIQDIIARLLGQPASIFGGQAPQPPGQQWPQANDFGLSDPTVASPPQDFIASPNPSQPLPPQVRNEGFRRMITDFTYGLGSGLSAATQNPVGRGLRTEAGMGAILQQPMVLQKAKEALAQQKRDEDTKKAQILLSILGQQQQAAEHAQSFGLQKDTFDLNKSNIEADNARAAQAADAMQAQRAEENRQKQDAEELKWNTPLNPSSPIDSQGSQYYAYPNPQGGDPILRKVGDIAEKTTAPIHDTVETAEGVMQFNEKTKRYDIRVGSPKPSASAASNPGQSADNVKYIADQVENDSTGQLFTKLVGTDKTLKDQVTTELRKRDSDLRALTPATRQLGETAHTLMPDFDKALAMLKSPTLQKKMDDVVGPRWQEFLAGKVGKGDPEFDQLRTFVSLLQTGTMRAHVGARGSSQMNAKFENLFNTNKMDAATLKDTLTATKDFLKGYENAVYNKQGKAGGDPLGIR